MFHITLGCSRNQASVKSSVPIYPFLQTMWPELNVFYKHDLCLTKGKGWAMLCALCSLVVAIPAVRDNDLRRALN